jgi:hypothetical protein
MVSLGGKLKYNLFIKETSKLEDLKFKEEIFEYVAFKANEMTEKDIITALDKLESHVILEAELKEFKFFMRNVLEFQEKFRSEFALIKLIKYFLKTYNKDLKNFFDLNSYTIENNKYDLDFSNLNAALLNFALRNLMKIENNFNLKNILDLLLLINFSDYRIKKEFLEKIQIKFLQNVNLNLVNSPFKLKGIIEEDNFPKNLNENSNAEIKNNNNNEVDLNMFLLMNLVIYQDNKFLMDESLLEILNYFNSRIADKYGLISYWDRDLNTRPQILKLENKELKVFNLIYGFMNSWIEEYKKENNKTLNENKIENDKPEDNSDNKNNLSNSLVFNLISNKTQLEIIQNLLKTIEKVILRNNKITKQVFLKKFKDDSIKYKDTVNKIKEVNNKLMDKIIDDMEKNYI